jgi:hypothetical protein
VTLERIQTEAQNKIVSVNETLANNISVISDLKHKILAAEKGETDI